MVSTAEGREIILQGMKWSTCCDKRGWFCLEFYSFLKFWIPLVYFEINLVVMNLIKICWMFSISFSLKLVSKYNKFSFKNVFVKSCLYYFHILNNICFDSLYLYMKHILFIIHNFNTKSNITCLLCVFTAKTN